LGARLYSFEFPPGGKKEQAMFSFFFSKKGKPSRGRHGSPAKRLSVVLFTLALIFSLGLSGCEQEPDGKPFVDDYKLNQALVGTWIGSGTGWSDTYIITSSAVSHSDGYPSYADASIEHVYNFSETAGCIIIKRLEDDKYTATYFKELQGNSVLLGDAYDVAIAYPANNDPAVNTLPEAKERFKPGNAELYGGGTAQGGTPQTRQ
jgi:hypothetical protein